MIAAVLVALVAAGVWAEEPAPSPTPPAAEYRVGPGDVLEVQVFGNDDLSRSASVQPSGAIHLPLIGEVPVSGLTVTEIQRKLVSLWGRDYLVSPQVEVRVTEYQSQFAFVVGEVNQPGRKPLRGRTRLIDVLVEAGGFTPRASGELSIARSDGAFEDGGHTLRLRLAGGPMTPQDHVNLEIPLRNGDIITAQPKQYVTVEGEVNRPGRYAIDGELSVTGAISSAGGLTRFGSHDVRVRRVDPGSGATEIVKVDLKKVRDGKAPDLALLPNDVVSIPRRLF
ncbi:MAG TPA: polysaccharide biosynthesis/export family protein [Vicinamibacteria bacterium]|nr:polysaccharide biosynthesis/export family protein [Vicinamibacteria bacterium]